MAILTHMLGEKVISGFKGTIDFYYYMGLPIARAWPKSPGRSRSPAVQAQWPAFSYASREWGNLSALIQRSYEELAIGTGVSGRDLFMKSYMKGLYRNPIP